MNILKRIHHFFNKLHTPVFILFMIFMVYIINIIFTNVIFWIYKINIINSYENIKNLSMLSFISPIFIAPWIETLVFQAFIIHLISNGKRTNHSVIKVLVSSLCFGVFHLVYNPFYSVSAFIVGIIFAYSYILYQEKKKNPVIITSLIHAGNNALALLLPIIIDKI